MLTSVVKKCAVVTAVALAAAALFAPVRDSKDEIKTLDPPTFPSFDTSPPSQQPQLNQNFKSLQLL